MMNKNVIISLASAGVLLVLVLVLSLLGVSPVVRFGLAAAAAGFVMLRLAATAGNRPGVRVAAGEQSRLLALPPPPDRAVLLVYREGFTGSRVGIDIAVDSTLVTQLRSPAFTRLLLSPGLHRLSASLNRQIANEGSGVLDFSATPGETMTIRLKMGAAGSLALDRELSPGGTAQKLAKMPMMQPDVPEI